MDEAYCSYYGILGDTPIRPWTMDYISMREEEMHQELKDMEHRIKMHITDCKREIVKTLLSINTKTTNKKEIKNGKPNKRKSVRRDDSAHSGSYE